MPAAPILPPPTIPGAKKLSLDPALPVAVGLNEAIRGVVNYALHWSTQGVDSPAQAVHEFRKSIRRARGLVKLLVPSLARDDYRRLNGALRELVQPTSLLRDADVLLDLVEAHPFGNEELGWVLTGLLRVKRDAFHRFGKAAKVLGDARPSLITFPSTFANALPLNLDRRALERGLKRSHRRAQRAWRCAVETPTPVAVHDWRKRVKELRYQLELVAPLTGPHPGHEDLAQMAEELGAATDRLVILDTMQAHRDALAPFAPEQLVRELEADLSDRVQRSLEGAHPFFAMEPKVFVRWVFAACD